MSDQKETPPAFVPKVNRSSPVEYRMIDGVCFVAYDLLEYFNTQFSQPLGYTAEPVDRSIVGDLSCAAVTLDEAFAAVSQAYTSTIRKSFNIKS